MSRLTDELSRIADAKRDIRDSISAKGVSIPSGSKIDTYGSYVSQISSGNSEQSDYKYFSDAESIVIPASVTKIGSHMFYYHGLKNVTFLGPMTSIGNYAFTGTPIESIVLPEAPDGSTGYSLAGYTFQSCKSLTSVVLPSTLRHINSNAFDHCISLTSVVMPSVNEIGSDAFSFCKSLESIDIPSNVTSISYYAFTGCENLHSITIRKTTPISFHGFDSINEYNIYVPAEAVDTYKTASGWSSYADRIYPIPES